MRRAVAIGLSAIATGASLIVACSSFSASERNPSDDAGIDAHTDSAAETSIESGNVDASDAGCSWFCDDFDLDPWPGPGWSVPDIATADGGGFSIITKSPSSGPRSLRAQLFSQPSAPRALIGHPNTASFAAVDCAVDVRVVDVGDEGCTLLRLRTKVAAGNYDLTVGLSGRGGAVVFAAGAQWDPLITALPIGTWVRVGIHAKIGESPRLTFGDVSQTKPGGFSPTDAGAAAFISGTLFVGLERGAGSAGTWTIDYDNLACSAQ